MIVTVTLNPAFDKALSVPTLTSGELHRVTVGPVVASGKGINVSRVLQRWGVSTKALILAGEGAKALTHSLDAEEIPYRMVPVSGSVRVNIKLFETVNRRMTELNEPGPQVSTGEWQQLEQALVDECAKADMVVFAGSLPAGAAPETYARLTGVIKQLGCKVVIDTSGPALRLATQASVYALKPNYNEALELLGYAPDVRPPTTELLASLSGLAVNHLILTAGEEGAFFVAEGQVVQAIPPTVTVGNTAGAGDSVLATYLAGLELGWSLQERAAKATAAGTAAVQGLGTDLCSPEAVHALLPQMQTHLLAL